MKKLSLALFLCLVLVFAIGCGKKTDEGSNNTTDEATQVNDKQNDMTADTTGEKSFPIRSAENKIVTIETDFGKMVLELYRDVAPAHADSFAARTADGFYDGLTFHRVIDNFMIQGGDPQGNGTGNAGYFLNAEFNKLPHQDGTLSMARGPSPNSASCQFFICLARNQSTSRLDGQYTVFGQLLTGYDVLHEIAQVQVKPSPSGEVSSPVDEIVMRRVYLSDAEGNPL